MGEHRAEGESQRPLRRDREQHGVDRAEVIYELSVNHKGTIIRNNVKEQKQQEEKDKFNISLLLTCVYNYLDFCLQLSSHKLPVGLWVEKGKTSCKLSQGRETNKPSRLKNEPQLLCLFDFKCFYLATFKNQTRMICFKYFQWGLELHLPLEPKCRHQHQCCGRPGRLFNHERSVFWQNFPGR